jgi:hypothetical protein
MTKRLLAVLAVLVVLGAGCGSGDDSSSDQGADDRSDAPAEDSPSEDDYASTVSDLCGDWFEEVLGADGSLREIAEEVSGTAEDLADDIEEWFGADAKGFGSIRVRVTIGATTWETSIFPDDGRGTYVLPVKKPVRKAEDLDDGSAVDVALEVLT